MSDLAIYDMDRTVTKRATYTPFLLHCAVRRAPLRLLLLPFVILSMLAYAMRLIDRAKLKEINHHLLLGRRIHPSDLRPLVESFAEGQLASNIRPGARKAIARDKAEENDEGPDDRLPKELEKREALRKQIEASLAALEKAERKHMHPLDPEARMMVSSGRTEFAYNAQAAVDQTQGIIVAADVTDQENDEHQLAPMLEQTRANTGHFAQTTVADSGYHTAEGLGAAAAMGADVLVAVKQKERELGPYHSQRFAYDETTDTVQCPQGQRLDREGTRRHRGKPYAVKTYRCKVWRSCPVASACSQDRGGRSIEISPHHDALLRNRKHPNARELLKQRHREWWSGCLRKSKKCWRCDDGAFEASRTCERSGR